MGKIIKRYFLIPIFIFVFFFLAGCNKDDFTCMHCGETITEETKYCPYCGEEILNSSDNNIEQCSHNWISASCTSPKTCSLCGETEGKALGHTTTTGVCERCNERQGWTAEEVQSLIKVYDVFVSNIDSADGVDMSIAWQNTSSKTIKYIYFTVEAYNAVDDKVYCEIRDYNVFIGSITGPLEPGYSNLIYDSYDDEYMIDGCWEDCYYNSTIRYFDLTNIRIIYMDNTEVEIGKGWCDYSLSDIPQGLYYTWNDEYNGYEVNYRLKDECTDSTITIPSTFKGENVVAISTGAFKGIESLEKINLPETITHIESYAFWGCSKLKNINIPNGITILETGLFDDCVSLETILLSNNITSIESYVFSSCTKLKEIIIPDSVTSIGNNAFQYCSSLKSLTIPDSVKSIGEETFIGCTSLTSLTLPFMGSSPSSYKGMAYFFESDWSYNDDYILENLKSVIITGGTKIPAKAFYGWHSITSIIIPDTVTSIDESAFDGCSSLTSIKIPEKVRSIGDYAFYNCSSLSNMIIPNNVTKIGEGALGGCANIEYLTLPFIGDDTTLDYIFSSKSYYSAELKLKHVIVTNTERIGDYAFNGFSELKSIIAPESITSIGDYAFYGCSGLSSILIPNGVINIGDYAFYGCQGLEKVEISDNVTSIGDYAFSDCTGLTNISLGNSITTIGLSAFSNCCNIENVVIPDSVITIGKSAFSSCTALSEIIMGNSVVDIGNFAFDSCCNLTNITIPNSVVTIGYYAFDGCSSLESITLPFIGNMLDGASDTHFGYIFGASNSSVNYQKVPASLKEVIITGSTEIGSYAFSGCDDLTNITLPNSLKTIGTSAFSGCSGLTNIVIPETVETIGAYAFNNCIGLVDVNIPNTVLSVGKYAFNGCTNLSNVSLGNSIQEIQEGTFYGCDSLSSIVIPNSVTIIGASAFEGCGNLTSVVLGNSITIIGEFAFNYCTHLESIVFSNSLTKIGREAFYYCWSLKSIIIPNSVTYIGYKAFGDCFDLTIYCEAESQPSEWQYGWNKCSYELKNGTYYCTVIWGYISLDTHEHIYTSININPTCIEQGYTLYSCRCGDNYKDNYVEALGHTEIIDKAIKETCTTSGLTEGKHCSVCNEVLIAQEEISPLGHTEVIDEAIESTCTTTGLTEGKHCSVCNEVLIKQEEAPLKHNYVDYVCNDCGYHYYSKGLEFELSDDGLSYSITDYTGMDSILVIPSTYNNKLVTSINDWAFYNCTSFVSIIIPNSVASIGYAAFYDCTSLKNVYYNGIIDDWCQIEFFNEYSNPMYMASYIYMKNSENTYYEVTSIDTPDSITGIGNYQFYGFENVTNIIINNNVEIIGDCAFSQCNSIKSIVIVDGVTTIGSRTFENCALLESLTIPGSITSIKEDAFNGCSSLNKVYYSGTFELWCNILFYNASSNPMDYAYHFYMLDNDNEYYYVKNIVIPNTVTSIGDYQFLGFANVTSITITNGVNSIGNEAFSNCFMLEDVIISNSIQSIGGCAFDDCWSIRNVYFTGTEEQWNSISINYGNSDLTNATIHHNYTSV